MAAGCLRFLAVSSATVLGAAVTAGIALLTGIMLLYIPWSIFYTSVFAFITSVLGFTVLLSTIWSRVKQQKSSLMGGNKSCCASVTMDIVLVYTVALASILTGAFALLVFFEAKKLPVPVRIGMHILIGTSVTLTLLINILDMFHMLQQSVQKSKCYLRYAAYPYKTVNFFDQPRQMYFLLICFTAIGVFLGYTYGQISSKEIDSFAGAASTFNPWAPMVPYLTQLLPISCTIGGLATGFAAYMG